MDRVLYPVLLVLLLTGVVASRPTIALLAHARRTRGDDILFFIALQNPGSEQRRVPILKSQDPGSQAAALCSEWSLDTVVCREMTHQIVYSWTQESLARADTRDTLSIHPTQGEDWQESTRQLDTTSTPLSAALRKYGERHTAMVSGKLPGRWLICQPTSGLGNQLNGIMSCMLAALASGRAMLLDWRATLRFNEIRKGLIVALNAGCDFVVEGLNAPSYPVGLNALFTKPVGWDWDINPVLRKFKLDITNSPELAHHSEALLCRNLSTATLGPSKPEPETVLELDEQSKLILLLIRWDSGCADHVGVASLLYQSTPHGAF